MFDVFLLCLVFGGGIGAFFNRLARQRHERKMLDTQHRNRVEILNKRRQIAEIELDAVKLLIVDEELGEDFNRRLRIALDTQRQKNPELTAPAVVPEADEDEAVLAEEEAVPRPALGRFRKRR